MKKSLTLVATAVIVLAGLMAVTRLMSPEDAWICVDYQWVKHGNPSSPLPTSGCVFDPKDATINIDGQTITLVNGVFEIPVAPDSASVMTTAYFGNKAKGDLNGDGLEDTAFLITQDGGGTGLFYYVVAAIKAENGYQMTNAFFIGDRISPQTTEIRSDTGELSVNYAERNPEEPMTAQPSLGVTLRLKVNSEGTLEKVPT